MLGPPADRPRHVSATVAREQCEQPVADPALGLRRTRPEERASGLPDVFVAVDPSEGCGSTGAYIEDRGICAAFRQAEFFGLLGGGAGGTGGSSSSSTGTEPGTTDTGAAESTGGESSSEGGDEGGERPTYDESAQGSCTTHYVAQRLDVNGYLSCGSTYGYIASVPMYRFGSCWSFDELGGDC